MQWRAAGDKRVSGCGDWVIRVRGKTTGLSGQDTYSSLCVFLVALKSLKVEAMGNFQGKQLVRLLCGFALSSPFIDSSRAGLWPLSQPQAGVCRAAGCTRHELLTLPYLWSQEHVRALLSCRHAGLKAEKKNNTSDTLGKLFAISCFQTISSLLMCSNISKDLFNTLDKHKHENMCFLHTQTNTRLIKQTNKKIS